MLILYVTEKNPRAFTPSQYLRTTDEMLKCYDYLPVDEVYEYVVTKYKQKSQIWLKKIQPIS